MLLIGQATLSMRKKSVTIDEIMYFSTGYYHLKTGDFNFNMTNPPLMKMLSAIPLLFLDLKIPAIDGNPKEWSLIKQWKFARTFLYENTVDADKILFVARLPIVFISVLLGFYVFMLSKDFFGEKAGLCALFLYCFSPNILAHSRLATHDLGLTAFMFISSYYFLRFCRFQSVKNMLLCGFFFGLALLVKTTGLFLIPIFALYSATLMFRGERFTLFENFAFVKKIGKRKILYQQITSLIISFCIIGLVGLAVLNLGYGLKGSFQPVPVNNKMKILQSLPAKNFITTRIADFALEVPLPVPSAYLEMIKFQKKLVANSGGVYFAGKIYDQGLWYLMFISFLIKTPVPLLIALLLSLAFTIKSFRETREEWMAVIFVSFIFFIFSYLSNINVGIRYVLPVFPFVHVLASRFISEIDFRNKWLSFSIGGLCIWYLISSVGIYPHYLAYFNESIGGPKKGYKYLVDSNLDWGQDLKGLKHYMDEKGIDKIKLAYFGSADANYYGINYDYLPAVGLTPKEPGQYWWYEIDQKHRYDPGPQKGHIAVSATLVASPGWLKSKFHETYEWLREHEPVDQIGYSILIYHIE